MVSRQSLVDIDFNSTSHAINMIDPTAAQDAATKAYVDQYITGLSWKQSVRTASIGNITVASPGTTIDGITMTTADRVLLKNQTTGSENGIYTFNGSATPMTRTADADVFRELEAAIVQVEEGTVNANTTWSQTVVNGTIGSTTNTWSAFGTSIPDASTSTKGKIQLATQGEVDTGTDALKAVTPATLAGAANRKLKYAVDVGDGSSTTITVTHNLATKDVTVAVFRNSGSFDEVACGVGHATTNTVSLTFTAAPASAAYRCVVLG